MLNLKIVTWNINSIKTRINHIKLFIEKEKPDILLLQEIKCMTESFPYETIEDLGYNIAVKGQKSYNGVAILSKLPFDEIIYDFDENPDPSHSRYIEALISVNNRAIRVGSVYIPNGGEPNSDKFNFKLNFFDSFTKHAKKLLSYEEILVLGGDYNVAPGDKDVYDPIHLENSTCFTHIEREKFKKLLDIGLIDIYRALEEDSDEYSWWDYRAGDFLNDRGMRIDMLLLSPEASDLAVASYIDKDMRKMERPSDHAPVIVELKF